MNSFDECARMGCTLTNGLYFVFVSGSNKILRLASIPSSMSV